MFRAMAVGLAALAASAMGPSAAAQTCTPISGYSYAVAAPTFNGSGTMSYLRLFNGAAATSTFSVTVVGSPSGCTYGSANIAVPSKASLQRRIDEILTLSGAVPLNGGDTNYALYIQNPDYAAGYQHVSFNDGNSFFMNNSICKYLLNEALKALGDQTLVLPNVHSSQLDSFGFPARVSLHNWWNTTVPYTFGVYDAVTGARVGNFFTHQAAPNASYEWSMAQIESLAGVTPTSNQLHFNILVTDAGQAPPATLGQSVVVSQYAGQITMSTVCAVNAPVESSSGGGGGIGIGW